MASCRPMFPKHTHAQNNTLEIHVDTATPSCVIPVARMYSPLVSFSAGAAVPIDASGDDGTSSGRRPSITSMPATPTSVDRQKPVLVRSIRYHRTGFAKARVRDACVVDCQGSLL